MATVTKFANANTVVTTGWTNPSNAYADDGVYATAAPGKNSSVTTDYGFPAFTTSDIPSGSTINSVTAEVQYKTSATGVTGELVGIQLNNNGSLLDSESTFTPATTDTTSTLANITAVALANLQTANQFKVRVRSAKGNTNTAVTHSVDYVKLTVDYNAPPSAALNSPADAGTAATTTPSLTFTGTDADANAIEYELQVDTVNTFDSGAATPALVQTVQGNGSNYVQTFTKSITPTAGNMLLVFWTAGDADTLSISDNNGNTWHLAIEQSLTGQRRTKIYYAYNCNGGTTTITFTSNNFSDSAVIIQEWSGFGSSDPLDKTAGASQAATSTTYTVGPTATTTQAKELIVGSLGCESNAPGFTGDSNFTNLITQAGFDAFTSTTTQYRVVSSASAYSWVLTNGTARQASIALATFKANAQPLLDKLSATPDASFTDLTNGAHTHPFPSGEQVNYAVQTGDALTAGATYYWRVRGKDPSGSNTFGAWSAIRSFAVSTGSSFSQTFTESLSLTPTLIKQGRKKLSQTLSLTASLLRQLSRGLTQTLALTPSLAASRLLSRPMTLETLSMSAALLRQPRKALSATLSLTTTLARQPGRRFAEAAALTASLRKQLARSLSEMISETSSVAMARTAHATPSATLTLTGSLIRAPRKTLPETATLTATLARRAGKRAAEALALADTTLRALNRHLAESVALTASLAKRTGKVLVGTTTLSATLGRSSSRALAETLRLLASLLKRAGKTLAGSTTLTATFNAVKATVKTINETIAATDTLVRAAALVLSDAVTLTGSLARQLGKRVQETLTATATLARQARKNLTEAVAASDTMIRTANAALTEAISISASLVRQSRIALRETLSLTATLARAVGRAFLEALRLSGQLAKQAGVFTHEVLSLLDQVTSAQNRAALTRVLSETLTVTDSLAEAFTRAKKAVVILATKAARAVLRLATKTAPAALTTRAATIELPTSVTSVELPTNNKPTTL